MTFRRVRVLLDRLPPESATHTAMRDQFTDEELRDQAKRQPVTGHGPLSRHDMFLIDVVDHLQWVEYAIYASQGGKPRKPEPTPRPGVPGKRKKTEVAPLNQAGLAHLQHLRELNRR
jgi:hypothetical protein